MSKNERNYEGWREIDMYGEKLRETKEEHECQCKKLF